MMLLLSLLTAVSPLNDTLTHELPAVSITVAKEQVPVERMASAVSAISSESIRRSSTYRPNSLSSLIPGLHIPDYGASLTSTIYLRGLGSRMENPVMGLYIDGIPVLDKNAYDFDWEGVQSVTMLRGPQGTLYGRNSMGGVLSLSTISPSEEARPLVRVEYGSANTLRAGTSLVAGDHAVSMTFRHTDGHFVNTCQNRLCDPYDGLAMRWKWVGHSRERLCLTNILMMNLSEEGGFAYGLWQDSVLHPVSYNEEGNYRRLSVIEGFRLNYCDEVVKTDALVSLQWLSDDMRMDQDYSPRSVFTLQQRQQSGAATMEFIARRTDADVSWQPQTGMFSFYRRNRLSAPVTFGRDGIESLILDNANSHIPPEVGYLTISDETMPVNSDFVIDSWNVALFHESVWDLDRWQITAGIRFDYEGARMDYDCLARLHYRFVPTMIRDKELSVPYQGTVAHHCFEIIPKLSLLYRVSDVTTCYSGISKGYRAGGFNTQIFSDILQNLTMNAMMRDLGVYLDRPYVSVSASNTEYDPESAWNMEVGARLRENAFHAEAALYCINVVNQQLTVFPPGMSTGRMMTNVGRSRSRGLETALGWNPDRFRSQLAWSWCDARFVDYNDGNEDYSGNRIPYVPQHTLFLGLGYSFKLNGKMLDFDAGLRGEGPFNWNESGSQHEPFRIRADGRVALVSDNWELYVRGENLTDASGRSFYFKSVGNEFFARVKPRTLMTGITFKL